MTAPAKDWKNTFLVSFAATGNVSKAAEAAGVNRRSVYKARAANEDFAAAWDEAREVAADALELEARRRAVEGIERPVFYAGKEVGKVREYSDTLLIVLLKAVRPEKFRDNAHLTHAGDPAAPIQHEHAVTVSVTDRINELAAAIERAALREEGIAPTTVTVANETQRGTT